jgi:hypothetical protein
MKITTDRDVDHITAEMMRERLRDDQASIMERSGATGTVQGYLGDLLTADRLTVGVPVRYPDRGAASQIAPRFEHR